MLRDQKPGELFSPPSFNPYAKGKDVAGNYPPSELPGKQVKTLETANLAVTGLNASTPM